MSEYEAYRKNIKSGDLIATTHVGWGSLKDIQTQMVRLFTESEYSHCGVVMKTNGRLFLVEAVVPTVRLRPLSELSSEGFYHIALKTPMSTKESEFALAQVGKGRYSKWEAIKGFLRTLRIGSNCLWQCSELVIACRKLSGVNLGDVATPSKVVQAALDQGFTLNYVKD